MGALPSSSVPSTIRSEPALIFVSPRYQKPSYMRTTRVTFAEVAGRMRPPDGHSFICALYCLSEIAGYIGQSDDDEIDESINKRLALSTRDSMTVMN